MSDTLKRAVLWGSVGAMVGLGAMVSAVLAETPDTPASVGSLAEVHINPGGRVLVRGANVTAINGATISAVVTWGSAVMNWTVKTDGHTSFYGVNKPSFALADISAGDVISFQGGLDQSSSQFTVNAKHLRDWSTRNVHYTGTVSSIEASSTSFMLLTPGRGTVKVVVTEATVIKKNQSTTTFAAIALNDRLDVAGRLNKQNGVLFANHIRIANPLGVKTIFEGKLKSLAASTTPTTAVVTIGGNDYTVNISATTSVLNFKWANVSIGSFHVGDRIRIYGAADTTTIDATVIRDVSLK